MNFEDNLRLTEEMLSMGQVLPPTELHSARAFADSIEENRKRADMAIEADKRKTAAATEAANQRTAAEIEAGRQRTFAAIEANRQLSDAAIRANKEIADQGIQESKKSSKIALWIAIPSLLLTAGSLLFAYCDSKDSKAWKESELIELKTANTNLEALNAGDSRVVESQDKQLQELKSLVSELRHQRSR